MTKIDGLKYLEGKLNIVSGGVADSSIDATVRSTMDNNPKEILFVGALKPRKGLIESIEALSKVKTDFVYRIVGAYDSTNPYVKLMQEKIKIYGLEKRVILLGSVSDTELDNLYKKADLFLMLSTNNGADFEGYGLVYLEANGRGVPVIGPNDSGVSDAVLDGKTGYLVDQYDPALVAGIIDNLLVNNPIKAQDCVDWARQNTSRIKAQKVWQIYNEINSR
jgi:phosphatidylinositol alpha-1,6-mannosyltransferase